MTEVGPWREPVELGCLPASEEQRSKLRAYAERGGWLAPHGSVLRWEHPDTGTWFELVPDVAGWTLRCELPAPLEAARDVGLAIRGLPSSIRPALPDGRAWDVDAWVDVFRDRAIAALSRAPIAARVVDDELLGRAWQWNRARHELVALYPALHVATAWLVQLGDRVVSAAAWPNPSAPIAVPDAELLFVVTERGAGAISFENVAPLLDSSARLSEGGWLLDPRGDPRYANLRSTAAPEPAFTRLRMQDLLERSVATRLGVRERA